MIIEWIVNLAAGLWTWLGSLIPEWDMPAELTDPGGMVEQIASTANGVGVLLDWPILTALALIPLGVWVVGLLWQAARMVISHIPFFGGR